MASARERRGRMILFLPLAKHAIKNPLKAILGNELFSRKQPMKPMLADNRSYSDHIYELSDTEYSQDLKRRCQTVHLSEKKSSKAWETDKKTPDGFVYGASGFPEKILYELSGEINVAELPAWCDARQSACENSSVDGEDFSEVLGIYQVENAPLYDWSLSPGSYSTKFAESFSPLSASQCSQTCRTNSPTLSVQTLRTPTSNVNLPFGFFAKPSSSRTASEYCSTDFSETRSKDFLTIGDESSPTRSRSPLAREASFSTRDDRSSAGETKQELVLSLVSEDPSNLEAGDATSMKNRSSGKCLEQSQEASRNTLEDTPSQLTTPPPSPGDHLSQESSLAPISEHKQELSSLLTHANDSEPTAKAGEQNEPDTSSKPDDRDVSSNDVQADIRKTVASVGDEPIEVMHATIQDETILHENQTTLRKGSVTNTNVEKPFSTHSEEQHLILQERYLKAYTALIEAQKELRLLDHKNTDKHPKKQLKLDTKAHYRRPNKATNEDVKGFIAQMSVRSTNKNRRRSQACSSEYSWLASSNQSKNDGASDLEGETSREKSLAGPQRSLSHVKKNRIVSWQEGVQVANPYKEHTNAQQPNQNSGTPSRANKSSRKRRRTERDAEDEDDLNGDDEQGQDGSRNPDTGGPQEPASRKKLACPYHKHEPRKYNQHISIQYRACSGPGWVNFKDVKDHIFRRHSIPIHCERCLKVFQDLDSRTHHIQQKEGCEYNSERKLDGVTQKHRDRIKREPRQCASEEDKWRKMYEILFPGEEVPCPYYDGDEATSPHKESQKSPIDFYSTLNMPLLVSECVDGALATSGAGPWIVNPNSSSPMAWVDTAKLKNDLTESLRGAFKGEPPEATYAQMQSQHPALAPSMFSFNFPYPAVGSYEAVPRNVDNNNNSQLKPERSHPFERNGNVEIFKPRQAYGPMAINNGTRLRTGPYNTSNNSLNMSTSYSSGPFDSPIQDCSPVSLLSSTISPLTTSSDSSFLDVSIDNSFSPADFGGFLTPI